MAPGNLASKSHHCMGHPSKWLTEGAKSLAAISMGGASRGQLLPLMRGRGEAGLKG